MMEITRFSLFCPHFSHHVLTFDSKNNIDIIAIVDDKVVVWKLTWMIFIKISSSSIIGNGKNVVVHRIVCDLLFDISN